MIKQFILNIFLNKEEGENLQGNDLMGSLYRQSISLLDTTNSLKDDLRIDLIREGPEQSFSLFEL